MAVRVPDWVMYGLVVVFVLFMVLAALVLLGPQISGLFLRSLYFPTALPSNTVTPIAVPTPDKLPSMKQICKGLWGTHVLTSYLSGQPPTRPAASRDGECSGASDRASYAGLSTCPTPSACYQLL